MEQLLDCELTYSDQVTIAIKIATKHEILVKLLGSKFGDAANDLTGRIRAIQDESVLDNLVTEIVSLQSIDELTLPETGEAEYQETWEDIMENFFRWRTLIRQLYKKFGDAANDITGRVKAIRDKNILDDIETQVLFIQSVDELALPEIA